MGDQRREFIGVVLDIAEGICLAVVVFSIVNSVVHRLQKR